MNSLPLSRRILLFVTPLLAIANPTLGGEATATNRPAWIERLSTNRTASPIYTVDWIAKPPPPQYQPDIYTSWQDLGEGKQLIVGDRVSSTNASRARLVNVDELAWLAENSAVVVTNFPKVPTLELQSGMLYFRSHGEPNTNLWVWVAGQPNPLRVLGTDFQLRRDRGTGDWLLTLVEGRVENVEKINAFERPGQVPQAILDAVGVSKTNWLELHQLRREIQWILHYPAVLHLDDLPWPGGRAPEALVESLHAYESGNLQEAWSKHEIAKTSISPNLYADPTLVIYRSNLLLGRGRVEEIEPDLLRIASLPETDESSRKLRRLAYASLKVAAAVRAEDFPGKGLQNQVDLEPTSATEWLAESYYQQSRIRRAEGNLHSGWTNRVFCRPPSLQLALEAAKLSTDNNFLGTNFWFGWIRKADLHFSHGDLQATEKALQTLSDNNCTNAPVLTLRGFVHAANLSGKAQRQALSYFVRALQADPDYTDAWLGLGLLFLRGADKPESAGLDFPTSEEAGLACLEQAAALEPARSLTRSYLGKAKYDAGKELRAEHELDAAKNLDPNDPTPWLYSGLAKHGQYRDNEAVRDLERSIELNDNRAIYRSDLLLDQDRAVRGANLAAIYRDAGLIDFSVQEASRSLNYDYANGSAHLFLANSYDALRDPQQFNLRYETPWLNELLLANLLKPVGAGSLSQTISQQEYSRLFDRDQAGIYSFTEYASRGDWLENGSAYVTDGPFSASFDAYYLSQAGERPNQDQENLALWGKAKYQITPNDSVLVQALYANIDSGDLAQYYDPASASKSLRVHETEEPIVLAGYHRNWRPGQDTLVLFSWLNNTQTLTDTGHVNEVVFRNPDGSMETNFGSAPFVSDLAYKSRLGIGSVELQHIWEQEFSWWKIQGGSLVAGARGQFGEFETENKLSDAQAPIFPPVLFPSTLSDYQVSSDFSRYSAYAYENLKFQDLVFHGSEILLTLGVCYDYLHYPVNHRLPPVSDDEANRDQVSPKVGLTWALDSHSTLRASYTRSLGGVSLDQSFRLEPTQVAGFLQSFRSLIPESVAGSIVAPTFETWGVAYDYHRNNVYAGVSAEWLESEADKVTGTYSSVLGEPVSEFPLPSTIDYHERNLGIYASYLLDDYLSFNARYRLSFAKYEETSDSGAFDRIDNSALFHELNLGLLFNYSTDRMFGRSLGVRHGFFSLFEAVWRSQQNYHYSPDQPGDNFWQFNLFTGYRFPRRAAELRVGVLNLTDQDYRLNPLNLHIDPPRERTFVISLRLNLEARL